MTEYRADVRHTVKQRAASAAIVLACVVAAGCSDDDDTGDDAAASTVPSTTASPAATSAPATDDTPTTTSSPSEAPVGSAPTTPPVPSTEPPVELAIDPVSVVGTLASDEFAGRDEGTDGWRMAQEYLVEQLAAFAQPVFPDRTGVDAFRQPGDLANLLAVIPGSELPDEYVLVGAHYDHLGVGDPGCRVLDPADTICNGATDNATGVAVALAAASRVAAAAPPRRSVLIGLWDREEDGLLGSIAFVEQPIVPLEQIVAYLNFDIQGANLLPSLRTTTAMVGAETGGPALSAAARRATEASELTTLPLSLVFGQGRSDHATFVSAGVPSVFFTDANNGCYHTTRDDIAIVDFGKLEKQIDTATALLGDLVATDDLPAFTEAPLVVYDDAVALLGVSAPIRADLQLVAEADRVSLEQYIADLQRIVDEGEAAFDDADVQVLLAGVGNLVSVLTTTECDGFLATG